MKRLRNNYFGRAVFRGVACLLVSAAVTMGALGRSEAAPVFQPGETMGLAFGKPLAEGIYGFDLEDYGHSAGAPRNLGVNLPAVIWSTPLQVQGIRTEVLYAAPFIHQNGSDMIGVHRMDDISQALGPIFAYDFGRGFNASLGLLYRSPDTTYHDYSSADFRLGLSYVAYGYNLSATFAYSGTFGGRKGLNLAPIAGFAGASDGVGVDLTASKRFGAFEVGVVGFAHTSIDTRLDDVGFNLNGTTFDKRPGSIAVGGLVGYNFGSLAVQGMVTREVAKRFAWNGLDSQGLNAGDGTRETRGWVRVSVPFYVAGLTAH